MFSPKSSRSSYEEELQEWADAYPAFVHYWYVSRYFRDMGRTNEAIAALRLAAKYPVISVDRDEEFVPNAFALDAAAFAYQEKQYRLVFSITDCWEADCSYEGESLVFRAAAYLATGSYDEADDSIGRAVHRPGRKLLGPAVDSLRAAIIRRDKSFVFQPGSSVTLDEWNAFPKYDAYQVVPIGVKECEGPG
jgi:tetratricopeptide (TPR) repeat protein